MNSELSKEADENYRMIAVKVWKDHRVMEQGVEFRINPEFYEDCIVMLDELSKRNIPDPQEDDSPEFICESGYEGCDHDDYDSMSDECKQDRAEAEGDARMDTYD